MKSWWGIHLVATLGLTYRSFFFAWWWFLLYQYLYLFSLIFWNFPISRTFLTKPQTHTLTRIVANSINLFGHAGTNTPTCMFINYQFFGCLAILEFMLVQKTQKQNKSQLHLHCATLISIHVVNMYMQVPLHVSK